MGNAAESKGLRCFFERRPSLQGFLTLLLFIITFFGGAYLAGKIGWIYMLMVSVLSAIILIVTTNVDSHPVLEVLLPANLTVVSLWVYKISFFIFSYSFPVYLVVTFLIVVVVCMMFYILTTSKNENKVELENEEEKYYQDVF